MVQLSHYQWLGIRCPQVHNSRARQRIRGPREAKKKSSLQKDIKGVIRTVYCPSIRGPGRDPTLGVALYVLSSFLL
jgi:hypothetical protein